jgi:phosphoglycolate phosphatase-like HAD superfamily hydrolase
MLPHRIRHWIFDLDGTLTKPVHDFAEIRAMLGLSDDPGQGILEQLAALPTDRRKPLTERLDAYELELAEASEPSDGAMELLEWLEGREIPVAIVTRNNVRNVEATLAAIGLGRFFCGQAVVTRETGPVPKPAPDGILWHLRRWKAHPAEAVMIGNHLIDVEAGRAAATMTVQIDQSGVFEWGSPADYHVRSLKELIPTDN